MDKSNYFMSTASEVRQWQHGTCGSLLARIVIPTTPRLQSRDMMARNHINVTGDTFNYKWRSLSYLKCEDSIGTIFQKIMINMH